MARLLPLTIPMARMAWQVARLHSVIIWSSLAVALAPKGIRVNAVAFGSVLSGSLQAALKDEPDWRGIIEAGTPLGRIAPASELVETVQYLASDAASFLTGQILTVDGGRSLLDPVAAPAH